MAFPASPDDRAGRTTGNIPPKGVTPKGLGDSIVAQSRDAIVAVDGSGAITLWNDAAAELFGHDAADVLGRSLDVIIPDAMRGEHAAGIKRLSAGGPSKLIGKPVEILAKHADGSSFPIEMRLSMWRKPAIGFGAIIRDVSERRRTEERLHNLAHFDQLTMLPNRDLFLRRLAETLEDGAGAAVLLLDLDNFADANDTLGHRTGDQLLRTVAVAAKRFSHEAAGASATVARIGPNQFAAVLPGLGDPLAASGVADDLRLAVKRIGEEDERGLTGSVGVALAPLHGADPARLLANADFALRRAKQDGGDRRRLFQPEMREAHRIRRDLAAELRRAWVDEEFEVFFQPQVRLFDRSIVGAEALLRWRHREQGLLLPGAFLHGLKDSRLGEQVGDFVLHEACRQAADWRRATGRPFRVGVNLFERQFLNPEQPATVRSALDASGLPPHELELEITETVMTGSDDASIRRVRRLRDLGVGIAFDDYGTGYASLGLLKRYPITRLKIDRSFVRDLANDREDEAIVDLVLGLGRRFGLGVIAEGVETVEQATWLTSLGCAEGQGFLFGKPMSPKDFGALLEAEPEPRRVVRIA